MPELVLYYCPKTCSEVSLCALEEAAIPYELELINIMAGDQFNPDYLEISPLNKVPVAVINGQPLTENAAILTYIARQASHTALLPASDADPLMQAQAVSGLSFCASTLHPLLRGMTVPQRLTNGDQLDAIREKSREMALNAFRYAESKIASNGWWLERWSIVDVYLNWTFRVALRAGLDASQFPTLEGLMPRLEDLKPSFRRMRQIEAESLRKMGL